MFQGIISVTAVILTLYLLKREVNIGIVMLINCVFIVIATDMPLPVIAHAVYSGLISIKTIGFVIILVVIMMMENIMRKTGMIKNIADNLRTLMGSSLLSSIMLPAVLGLLPSPGGARFSCPMVEEILGEKADNTSKAFLNYWFRHVWMDGFILYPGAILAAELLNVPVLDFFLHLLPFCAIHIIIGLISLKGVVKESKTKLFKYDRNALVSLFRNIFPVILIIMFYIILLRFTVYALYISATFTVLLLLVYKRYGLKDILKTFMDSFKIKYVIVIVGVMVFMEFLTESRVVDGWMEMISYYNIPREVLFVLLPFIGGVASGLSVSHVSISFPILIQLGLGQNLWFGVLAYASGFAGIMITPLHLCAVMSSEYFKVKLNHVLKRVLCAESLAMVFIVAFLLLL